MVTQKQKQEILAFAKKMVASNDRFHKMSHILEAARNAVWLAKEEGADVGVCWTSAMLHDICKSKPGNHGTNGAVKAEKFLVSIGMEKASMKKVVDAIHFHNKEFASGSLERKILWDADKMTVMSPSGFSNRLLADAVIKYGPDKGIGVAIRRYHFFYKRFHTKTGRMEIGRNRDGVGKKILLLQKRKQ